MGGVGLWALARLLLSGAAKKALKGLSAAARWLVSDWRNGPLVVCALMWAAHALMIVPARDRKIAETERLLTDTQTAFVETIVNVTAASAKAQADAEANAARVKAEQERITDATVRSYHADLDRLRARAARLAADRLRARSGAAVDPRHPDAPGLPAAGDAAGRAAEAPGEDRLPPPGLSLDDALIASQQALQLNALIDWIEAQSAVRFTPEKAAE